MALSSTEGEYIAMMDVEKEAICLKGLSEDVGIKDAVTRVFYDNQGAGCLSIGRLTSEDEAYRCETSFH